MKFRSLYLLSYLLFFSCILFVSCKEQRKTDVKLPQEEKNEEKNTEVEKALEYEFNMLKDPLTGKIPENAFTDEKEQARQLYFDQLAAGRIAANSYLFQGPNNLGGRTRAIAYDVRFNGTSNQVILAGGVSGGMYKSTDNGATWVRKSPLGEHFSCTSIAQDPRPGFQDTWYYGVGEAIGNSAGGSGAFYSGNGVYKSTDNGETWSRLTSSNGTALESFSTYTDFISKVVVDPTNGNVYIACPAAILRSTNGGTSWSTVLSTTLASTNQHTDIVVTSTGIFYASFAGVSSLSAVDGVWTSSTGASGSWTRIAGAGNGGSPVGWNADNGYGRVVLAIAPSDEDMLYALYYDGTTSSCAGTPDPEAELFQYDAGITTWTNLSATLPDEVGCSNGNDPFAVQGGYDLVIAVKPDDPATLFIGGTNLYRSTNTGSNWTRIGGYANTSGYGAYADSHPDIHAIVFDPTSSTTMLCGNDGGIQKTTNNLAGTVSWTQSNTGYRTYQYYYVDIDPRTGNDKVIGGAQDNGTTRNVGGTGTTFEQVLTGDGVSVGLTDLISSVQYEYCGTQNGNFYRRNAASAPNFGTAITPTGESGSGLFVTLFKIDADNSENVYYANDNVLYRTTSGSTVTSATWTSMTGISTAVGAANDISAIALTRGTYSAATSSLFFGTSDGRLFRLDNPTGVAASTSPVNITGGSFSGYVSSIAVNPRNDDTLLVTFSNYGVTSAWWTGNANAATPTWTNVEGALTLPSYRSAAIHVVPNTTEVHYFVGTSTGLYSTTGLPGSISWTQEGASEIGNAIVSSLAYRPSDGNLLVGTHGYGMWKTELSLIALPVQLTEFKGVIKQKNAMLIWKTSSEQNSSHFEIERSENGINFRRIGTVQAAGNSNTVLSYSFIDKQSLGSLNYYRLRSVDADSKNKISDIVLLKYTEAEQGMQVFGNPVSDRITIQFLKPLGKNAEAVLTDMGGRVILKKQLSTGVRNIVIPLNRSTVQPGTYILQVIAGNEMFTQKIIKQ